MTADEIVSALRDLTNKYSERITRLDELAESRREQEQRLRLSMRSDELESVVRDLYALIDRASPPIALAPASDEEE